MNNPGIDIDPAEIQRLEIEALTDIYDRMIGSCTEKCLESKIKDGALSKGESTCLNRCVSKFFDLHNVIGEKMQQMMKEDAEKKPL